MNRQILLVVIILIGCISLIYIPGLSGPFIFDDFANIVKNRFLHFDTLSLSNLSQAALSSDSGPLKRPVSMLTFGINAYFAGGTDSPFLFNLWNLVIH